jgi:hypothetical protein
MKQKVDEFTTHAAVLTELLLELADGLHELRNLRYLRELRERQERPDDGSLASLPSWLREDSPSPRKRSAAAKRRDAR